MAIPKIEANLTNIDNAEVASNWAGFNEGGGGTPTPQDEGDIFIQGTQAVSAKVSGSSQNKGVWFDTTTGIDMTVSGRHLYIWIAVTTIGILNDIANGGIYIKIASDAAGNNWNKYFVGGSDVTPDARFVRYVIDLNKTPSETAATAATLTSVRWFGAGIKSTGSAKAENLVVDRMDYGDGLRISEGDVTDPVTWQSVFEDDDNINNKYGIIEKRSETFFLKGGIQLGDASGIRDILWLDTSNPAVVFEDPQYYNGDALVSSIDSQNLYKILVTGNSTGSTDVEFGVLVGSGTEVQGIGGGSMNSAGPPYIFDALTNAFLIDNFTLHGMNIQNAGFVQMSGFQADIIGCFFAGCDEIKPLNSQVINSTISEPIPDHGMEVDIDHNVSNISFIAGSTDDFPVERAWSVDDTPADNAFVDETDNINSDATGDVTIFPATEASGDYMAFGSRSRFYKLRFDTGTAGVGGTVLWEYWNGASWAALSGVSDGTTNFTTTGLQDVTYNFPRDWQPLSIHDETPLCYIRAKVDTVYSTNPIGDQAFIADRAEHHIHLLASGTYVFSNIQFFGHSPSGLPKWHGIHSNVPIIINATAGSNPIANEFDPGPVTVNNTKILTLTGLESSSEIRIYDEVGGKPTTERDGIESSSTTFAHSYNYEGSDIPVIIVILHINFLAIRLFLDLGDTDQSIPIQQFTDRAFSNP